MRSFLVGFILLLASAGSALGQATGYVSALGFQGTYRPDCWTPLLVRLESTVSTAEEYQIQVRQQDLDKDTVVFTRTVTLGPSAKQDYWVYFIPQPTGGRGVDGGSLPSNPKEVAEVLSVHLLDKKGKYEVARLPAMVTANNIDGVRLMGRGRGHKLILCVVERDKPSTSAYQGALGIAEDVDFVTVGTRDLPESVLGYEAIDGMIWLDANAQDISTGGSKAFDALQDYVRRGGQLVVCQPPDQFGKIAPFGNAGMLPIVLKDPKGEWAVETRHKGDLKPLIDIANPIGNLRRRYTALEQGKGPWDFARARATPDAVVDPDYQLQWNKDNPKDISPYIARKPFGLGTVTWVAQDLGAPMLNSVGFTVPGSPGFGASNWARVWDTVFAWRSRVVTNEEYADKEKEAKETDQARWSEGNTVDLGSTLLRGLDHAGKATAYIFLAVLFFIGYWVIAGPGSYLFLAARKKPGLSWAVFGLAAVVAAGLTILLVRLVLHGPAEARHLSVVRLVPGAAAPDGAPRFQATMKSRIGLYIPRDGEQSVSVTNNTPGQLTTLIPLPIHPQYLGDDTGFTDRATYFVNTDQFESGQPVTVDFPYRRTQKKIEASWTGTVAEGIVGAASIVPEKQVPNPASPGKMIALPPRPSGRLTNQTGRDLGDVYVAFSLTPGTREWLMHVPSWSNGQVLDLEQEFLKAAAVPDSNTLSSSRSTKGLLTAQVWGKFWYGGFGSSFTNPDVQFDDSKNGFTRSLPMMAFYTRIEPQQAENLGGGSYSSRIEVLRRGGRGLDMSQLLAAGQLVIVAHTGTAAPLPLPLDVEGDKVEGEGTTIFEIALPIDRTPLYAPATQPTTRASSEAASSEAVPHLVHEQLFTQTVDDPGGSIRDTSSESMADKGKPASGHRARFGDDLKQPRGVAHRAAPATPAEVFRWP